MNDLDKAMQEFFEERAAILEFACGIPKEKAEALAKAECETYRKHVEERNASRFNASGNQPQPHD